MAKPKRTTTAPPATAANDVLTTPPWRWLVAALAVGTLSLAWPVFLGRFLVNPHSDQYIAGYGFREFAAHALRNGDGFPQWNPYLFGGLPYIAAMHGDIFYPTFLLRLVMRTDLAMTWGFIVHLFLAGAFTLGFLRAMRFGAWPAVFGGAAYMLSGSIASYASPGHDGKLFVSALLPLALWMLVRAIRDNRPWAWGVFALTIGLAVLSPHPQLLQFLLLVAGSFALYLVWTHASADARPANDSRAQVAADAAGNFAVEDRAFNARFAVTRLGAALGMVLVGAAIGAVQYWPVLGYVNVSPRANGEAYDFATQFSMPPEELINTYLPQFSGLLDSYWGRNSIHLHSEYMGVAVLMFASLAFGSGTRKGLSRFWLGTLVVSLLWALGQYTPFFHLVYWIVPGTRYFRAPSTMLYVVTFALVMLATLGFERVLERRATARAVTRTALAWGAMAIVMLIFAAGGPLNAFAHSVGHAFAVSHGIDPAGFGRFIEANRQPMALGALRSLVFVLIVAGALIAYQQRKLRSTAFAVVVVLATATDLFSIARQYWLFSDRAAVLYSGDGITDYLKAQKEPGRVFVYAKTADFRAATDPFYGGSGFGMGTGLMVHGIRSATGYHGNAIARYETLADGNGYVSPGFWRHENMRWLYSNMEIADTVLKKLVGPVTNSAGSTAFLYSMPGDNPYAWVATAAATANDSVARAVILANTTDPKSVAMFDSSYKAGGPLPSSLPAPSTITAKVANFGAGFADIALSTPAAAGNVLVVSENFYPGWTARVDGKPAPVLRADYNILGVQLPAGARTVSLHFEDPRYATGRLITWLALALTLALTLALIGAGVAMRRRSV